MLCAYSVWNWMHFAYTQYSSDVILRILSMFTEFFCVYSVRNWRIPAYTQYVTKWPQSQLPSWTILSIRRKPSFSFWVYAENHHFHTEYTQKTIIFILSIRRKPSFSYWVYAESHLNYTEYKLGGNHVFGQTKPPPTHLIWLFIGKSSQGG